MGWLAVAAVLGAIPLGPKGSAEVLKVLSLQRDIWLLRQINSLGLTKDQVRQLVEILGEFHAPRLKAQGRLRSLAKDLERARRYLLAGREVPKSLKGRLEEAHKLAQAARPTPERLKEVAGRLKRVLKPEQWERAARLGAGMAVVGALLRSPQGRRALLAGMGLQRRAKQIFGLLERVRGMSDEEFEKAKGRIASEIAERLGFSGERAKVAKERIVKFLSRVRGMSDREFEAWKRRAGWGALGAVLRQFGRPILPRGPMWGGPRPGWGPPMPYYPRGWRPGLGRGWRPPAPPIPGGPMGVLLRRPGPEGVKDLMALRFLLDPRVYDLLKEKLRHM